MATFFPKDTTFKEIDMEQYRKKAEILVLVTIICVTEVF